MKRNFGAFLGALLLSCIAFPTAGHAAKFANQFTEFDLPPQWQCNLEGAEWVCQSTNDAKKRDAIIVLAAKLKGDQDSMEQYLAYLKAAKTFTSVQGKPVKSEPKYAKEVNINGQPWIDSLHLESEIPGFYTRYLATVKTDIGVLISMNVNKAKYQEYLSDFDNLVKSVKVFHKTGAVAPAAPQGNLFNQAQVPVGNVQPDTVFGGPPPAAAPEARPRPIQKQQSPLLLILVAVGAVGFIIWKKRQSSGA